MTVYSILGILSGVVCGIGYLPYIYATIKKKNKPHPFSWILWSVLNLVSLITYMGLGAHETMPLAIMNFIGPLVIAIMSIKYWVGSFSKFDYVCLFLSAFSVLIYLVFHSASTALTFNLVADFLVYLPTMRKAYREPETEDLLTWILFFIANILSVFAISKWSYGIGVFPVYLAVTTLIVCATILLGRARVRRIEK